MVVYGPYLKRKLAQIFHTTTEKRLQLQNEDLAGLHFAANT